jgi:hypothetical protein
MPWGPDIGSQNEWRVFVPPSGRVKSISQYPERDAGWRLEKEEHAIELEELSSGAHMEASASV